jgi:hypothetical protein
MKIVDYLTSFSDLWVVVNVGGDFDQLINRLLQCIFLTYIFNEYTTCTGTKMTFESTMD